MQATKICTKCRQDKPLTDFNRYRKESPKLRNICRPCSSVTQWKQENRERHNLQMMLLRFNAMGIDISVKMYLAMLQQQNGVCAICKQKETKSRNGRLYNLAVDHDHKTGKIRGLLCSTCNCGLGHFKDEPARLLAAAQYVSSFLAPTQERCDEVTLPLPYHNSQTR